jgi:hypothetical protein
MVLLYTVSKIYVFAEGSMALMVKCVMVCDVMQGGMPIEYSSSSANSPDLISKPISSRLGQRCVHTQRYDNHLSQTGCAVEEGDQTVEVFLVKVGETNVEEAEEIGRGTSGKPIPECTCKIVEPVGIYNNVPQSKVVWIVDR